MSKESIKTSINTYIKENGNMAITGQILNSVMNEMVEGLASEEELATKQDTTSLVTDLAAKVNALSLSDKAAFLGQISAMPATPSGDPMHNYYISLGMKYENGFFQFNGLNLTASEALETLKSLRIVNQQNRTNGCRDLSFRTNIPDSYATTYITTEQQMLLSACFASNTKLEVVNLTNNKNINYPTICSLNYAFLQCRNLKKVIDYIRPLTATGAFDECSSLSSINLVKLSISISFKSCPLLSSESILFMIQNEAATSAITITLHADAYARAMANADIVAALQAHPNVSLASA